VNNPRPSLYTIPSTEGRDKPAGQPASPPVKPLRTPTYSRRPHSSATRPCTYLHLLRNPWPWAPSPALSTALVHPFPALGPPPCCEIRHIIRRGRTRTSWARRDPPPVWVRGAPLIRRQLALRFARRPPPPTPPGLCAQHLGPEGHDQAFKHRNKTCAPSHEVSRHSNHLELSAAGRGIVCMVRVSSAPRWLDDIRPRGGPFRSIVILFVFLVPFVRASLPCALFEASCSILHSALPKASTRHPHPVVAKSGVGCAHPQSWIKASCARSWPPDLRAS
jgi:hypothetical protein